MPIHARARAKAIARVGFEPRAQINFDPPYVLSLIAPALLMALLNKWASIFAPGYGVFFTTSTVAILYCYYAVMRAVFVHHHTRDSEGRFDGAKARKAEQDFYRVFQAKRETFAFVALPLLALASIADVMTLGGQTVRGLGQARVVVLLIELAVWLWLGPALLIACVRWSTLKPFDFQAARRIASANRGRVRWTFLLAMLVFAAISILLFNLFYEPLRATVVRTIPSVRAILLYSVLFHALIAGIALWVQGVWSEMVAAKLADPGPGDPRPAAGTTPERVEPVQNTPLRKNISAHLFFSCLGFSAVLLFQIGVEIPARRSATVTGFWAACEYEWRYGKRTETKVADCATTPAPDKAPRDASYSKQSGLNLDVSFRASDGKEVKGTLFVPSPEAERAVVRGTYTVVHLPRQRDPIRRPMWTGLTVLFAFVLIGAVVGWRGMQLSWRNVRAELRLASLRGSRPPA